MKQRYNDLTIELAYSAVKEWLKGKIGRGDVLDFLEKKAGIDRAKIYEAELSNSSAIKDDVKIFLSLYLMDLVNKIINDEEVEVKPVKTDQRVDGMTGKIRNIATLDIPHQLLGHLAKKALEPLFKSKILPTQYASIPGKGQTRLKNDIYKYLNNDKFRITYYEKLDITNAYGSLKYDIVIEIIKAEIPSAKWILKLLYYLKSLAPGGHLIIGGYLDAWLFNYSMSYGIRYILSLGKNRRGKYIPYVVKVVTFMDDFVLLGTSYTGINIATKELIKWFYDNLELKCHTTTGIVKLLSEEEESERKELGKASQRGCPNIDMGGYRVSKTHITMRPRVAKRVIRAFVRARKELDETGTIRITRAKSLISRYGNICQTSSYSFKKKYDVDRIMSVAKRVARHHNIYNYNQKRKRMQNVVQRYNEQCSAREDNN